MQTSALTEEVWVSAWIALLMFLGYVRSFKPGVLIISKFFKAKKHVKPANPHLAIVVGYGVLHNTETRDVLTVETTK